MRKTLYSLMVVVAVLALLGAAYLTFAHSVGAKATASCQTTSFSQDGNPNLTAAMVVTTSSTISATTVNGSGCDIGIYVQPGLTVTIANSEVYGSTYDGIVNDGSKVTVSNSRIHDIGDNPLDGVQYGYGIFFSDAHQSKGKITGNVIWNYQKNGIVVRGVGSNATISKNTVLGQGPVNYIAQNGIELGAGAKGTISNNIVQGNSYTGSNGGAASGGILIYGGSCNGTALTTGIHITGNIVVGNDVGLFISNIDGDPNNPSSCIPTLTPTKIVMNKNIVSNDGVNNTGGNNLEGQCCGYQAGVSDQGDGDQITNNGICGLGYTPANTPPPYYYAIDVTFTNSPTESGNYSCLNGSSVSALPRTSVKPHEVRSSASV